MKTLQTISNLSADVIKSHRSKKIDRKGGLELLTSLVEQLEKQLKQLEGLIDEMDEGNEFRKLKAELIRVQLDLLNQRKWKFEE